MPSFVTTFISFPSEISEVVIPAEVNHVSMLALSISTVATADAVPSELIFTLAFSVIQPVNITVTAAVTAKTFTFVDLIYFSPPIIIIR